MGNVWTLQMRRFAGVLALALVATSWFGLSAVPHAAADPYTPTLPTGCTTAAARVVVGEQILISVQVSANSAEPVVGKVELSITPAASPAVSARSAAPVWTKVIYYTGSPMQVRGPSLPAGRYTATAAFTSGTDAYLACTAATGFRVRGAVGGEIDENEGGGSRGDAAGGALPNTGGPHLQLLLLGVGLTIGGGIVANRSQRTRRVA